MSMHQGLSNVALAFRLGYCKVLYFLEFRFSLKTFSFFHLTRVMGVAKGKETQVTLHFNIANVNYFCDINSNHVPSSTRVLVEESKVSNSHGLLKADHCEIHTYSYS